MVRLGAGTAGVTSAANLAAAHDLQGLLLFGLFGVTALALAHAIPGVVAGLTAMAGRFNGALLGDLAQAHGVDTDTARADLEARAAKEPAVQRTMVESARQLLEAIAPEAAEPLGRLASEYIDGSRAPDGFFRGVARTLSDVTSQEYATLVKFVRLTWKADVGGAEQIAFINRSSADTQQAQLHYLRPNTPEDRERLKAVHASIPVAVIPDVERIFHLLKTNGVGRESSSAGTFGGGAGPHHLVMHVEVLRRLAVLLGIRGASSRRKESRSAGRASKGDATVRRARRAL